jgi:hypothetical protein
MKSTRRPHLSVETLEDRCVPATVTLSGSNLLISNPTYNFATRSTSLTLTQVAQNKFTVVDSGRFNGTYGGVSNISVTGTNAPGAVTVDLNGLTYTGNLSVSMGNGSDTFTVTSSGAGTGGAVLGNLSFNHGYGNSTVSLNGAGTTPMTYGGTVQVTAPSGVNTSTSATPRRPPASAATWT